MNRVAQADITLEALGDGAARFALPEGTDPRVALEALRECAGIVDAIVCETHACVYFDEPPVRGTLFRRTGEQSVIPPAASV